MALAQGEAQSFLDRAMRKAQNQGRVGRRTPLRISSQSVGTDGKREFFCLGRDGKRLKSIKSITLQATAAFTQGAP